MATFGTVDEAARDYDAVVVVAFGGPEGPDEVMPFLKRVTAGRQTPPGRLAEVADHYQLFGGVSPLNAQTKALVGALRAELSRHGPDIPVYWGNRHWHPLLAETVRRMAADGARRAAAFVTAGFASAASCRAYLDDLATARAAVGAGAPHIDKLRLFYNHPGFVEPQAAQVRAALAAVPAARRQAARLVFTAHSLPRTMAQECDYEAQLREACRLVVSRVGTGDRDTPDVWDLVYQSRSGPPQVPWLEPDVCDHLESVAAEGVRDVVVVPIGFVSDHMEVVYDLDVEAARRAAELGLTLVRARTVGAHPAFVAMIRELVVERMETGCARRAWGRHGPSHDVCAPDCCTAGSTTRRDQPPKAAARPH